ncbi:hypothetical protein DZG03_17155, partial [Clavibacter phaseoli]
ARADAVERTRRGVRTGCLREARADGVLTCDAVRDADDGRWPRPCSTSTVGGGAGACRTGP